MDHYCPNSICPFILPENKEKHAFFLLIICNCIIDNSYTCNYYDIILAIISTWALIVEYWYIGYITSCTALVV